MSESLIVKVAQGELRGKIQKALNGEEFISFLGIPYAKPPVGDLRFKAPAPVDSWTGVRDATSLGNECFHLDPLFMVYKGDEDCLYLNVYTPQLPDAGEPKAVMVYIHGGGFTTGSGNPDVYGPDFFINENVVLVTLNYRLGPLGFLTTEDAEIPGNAGMKDQVSALKWVQQNIASFGGDPGNVTIFGESAGGASVHYLVLSHLAKGLFKRAIAQSGSALNSWALSTAGKSRTLRLAKLLGCESEDTREVTHFLRSVSVQRLVENQGNAVTDQEKRRGTLAFPFVPIFDGGFKHNEEIFLPRYPIDILRAGEFNKVDLVLGLNTNEGLLLLKDVIQKPEVYPELDKDFQGLLPEDLFPSIDTPESIEAANKMKRFYFKDQSLNKDTLNNYALLQSDTLFVYKINEALKLHAAHINNTSNSLYYYQFAYDGPLGMFKRLLGLSLFPGTCHADELGYLFNISFVDQGRDSNAPEMKIRKLLLQLWTNFAKKGLPSTQEVTWSPVTLDRTWFLNIDKVSTMEEEMEPERVHFWDELYKTTKKY